MNAVLEMFLTGERLSDGHFLIKAASPQGEAIPPGAAASVLFAWDDRSFYGTFIETTENGLLLGPMDALSFFTQPHWLSHLSYELSPELSQYQQMAQRIWQALCTGAYLPNLCEWKQGHVGWKLPDTEEPLPLEGERWLSDVLAELLSQPGGAQYAWQNLQRHYPALLVHGEELAADMNEADWLQAIGLLPDDTPFRTCLQLVEPEDGESKWGIKLLLQDREQSERLTDLPAAVWSAEADLSLPDDWETYRHRLSRDVQRCREILVWLPEAIAQADHVIRAGSAILPITNELAWTFLTEGSLQLVKAGIHVWLPAWWEQVRRTKPRLRLHVSSRTGGQTPAFFGIGQLMDFQWKLAVGALELDEQEFLALLEQKQRLLKVRGEWVQLTPGLFAQLQETLRQTTGKHGLSLREVMKLHLLGATGGNSDAETDTPSPLPLPVEVEVSRQLFQFLSQLQDTGRIPLIDPPAGFAGTLRSYQREGSSWLLFLRKYGLGACLADDMGLGKTIQFITYLLAVKEQGIASAPSLLICPTSVIGNWQKELERFAPTLSVYVHYGASRKKGQAFWQAAEQADVVITSYSLAFLDESELDAVRWDTICLDEAQHIKNAQTKQATAIRKLNGRHRIALTGTPIENRLRELWSIYDFLNPGYLGTLQDFSQRYVLPIERDHDQVRIAEIQRLIQPFLLRRVKTDPQIQLDLPEKSEIKEYVPLTAEQGALYETLIQRMFDRLDESSPMQRRGLILTTLTRLKQLCDHPALIDRSVVAAGEEKRSPKVERLLELLQEIREKKERSLIFTQYIEMGRLLQRVLEREGYGPVFYLNGSTPKEQRDEMIARFQDPATPDEQRPSVFLLSLRAGGTGLNLTAANHVFHIDRWWNPAVENQATDRAYRIGQERNVQVYKFISLGTIEERIDEMMERKLNLSQQIVGNGDNWITELSTEELRELFLLRREWLELKG